MIMSIAAVTRESLVNSRKGNYKLIVDLSHWNSGVEQHSDGPVEAFKEAKLGGVEGVILKATQGLGGIDPTFQARWQALKEADIPRGAYHFGTGGIDGTSQADAFLKAVDDPGGAVLALDMEPNGHGPNMTAGQAWDFVNRIKTVVGRFPLFYISPWWVKMVFDRVTPLSSCPLWLAQYAFVPTVPTQWTKYTLWQYTDGSRGPDPLSVAGIGLCDQSKLGEGIALSAFWGS